MAGAIADWIVKGDSERPLVCSFGLVTVCPPQCGHIIGPHVRSRRISSHDLFGCRAISQIMAKYCGKDLGKCPKKCGRITTFWGHFSTFFEKIKWKIPEISEKNGTVTKIMNQNNDNITSVVIHLLSYNSYNDSITESKWWNITDLKQNVLMMVFIIEIYY